MPPEDDEKRGPSGLTRAEIVKKAAQKSAELRIAKSEANTREQLTPEQLTTITAMATVGVLRPQIAKYLRCSVEWLREHYGDELDAAEVSAVAKVAQTLYTKATSGKDLGAAIFYLKVRGGWRENPEAYPREKEVDTTGALQRFSAMIDKLVDAQQNPNAKEPKDGNDSPDDRGVVETEATRTSGTAGPTH
jgi:hypothetical protein